MARKNTEREPERTAVELFNMNTGQSDVVAVAERLADHPEWAAVMLFLVGSGDTRLFAHLVVPGPVDWTPFGGRQKWLSNLALPLSVAPPESTQLTTRIVRSVNSGELERWARSYARAQEGSIGIPPGATGDDRKTRAPAGGGDRRLASIAARYVELLESSATPIEALRAELHLSRNTISSYIFKARERGLLTSPGQGRAGGALTDRARQILDEGEN